MQKKKKKKSLSEHHGARDAKDDRRQGTSDARHGGGPSSSAVPLSSGSARSGIGTSEPVRNEQYKRVVPCRKKKKNKLPEPHKDLLPAELALSKIEEVDPLHEERRGSQVLFLLLPGVCGEWRARKVYVPQVDGGRGRHLPRPLCNSSDNNTTYI